MRKLITVVLLGSFVILGGCGAMTLSPASGFLYTDATGPFAATSNSGDGKTGTAQCVSYLGLIATGDCSIQAAMKSGGITKVTSVDYHAKNILGFYAELTVIVTGN